LQIQPTKQGFVIGTQWQFHKRNHRRLALANQRWSMIN
jgi:hypothetical protein